MSWKDKAVEWMRQLEARRPLLPLAPGGPVDRAMDEGIGRLQAEAGGNPDALAAVSGLLLWNGNLDRSHTISQGIENPTGSYWHGIMHRMEGDYWNAKYWFRRVGRHPAMSRLRDAARTSPVRGMLRAPNQIRRGFGPGWALVGDAAYHRDPVTGHGLSDAYRDAELLAVALDAALTGAAEEREALDGYEQARLRESAEIFDLTCALAKYPPVATFIELNRRLGAAIDAEAAALAARPVPGAVLARP